MKLNLFVCFTLLLGLSETSAQPDSSYVITVTPEIVTHPQSKEVTLGSTLTLAVEYNLIRDTIGKIEGEWIIVVPLTKWQKFNDTTKTWTDYFTSEDKIDIQRVSMSDCGSYRAIIIGDGGCDTSNTARVIVNSPPIITCYQFHPKYHQGTNVELSTCAIGNSIRYQWQKKSSGDIWADLPGEEDSTMTVYNLQIPAEYRCVLKNLFGSDTTDVMNLDVYSCFDLHPITFIQPVRPPFEGESIYFYHETECQDVEYLWYKQNQTTGDYELINGADSSKYGFQRVLLSDAGNYRTTASDGLRLRQVDFSLTVLEGIIIPRITVHPKASTVAEGDTATFEIKATGSFLQYQWQIKEAENWKNLDVDPGQRFSIKNANSINESDYRCIVFNTSGADTSQPAYLTVITLPQIEGTSVPIPTKGDTCAITVVATGDSLQYSWQKRRTEFDPWQNIPDKDDSVLLFMDIQYADTGEYRSIVFNRAGSDTTRIFSISVAACLTIPIQRSSDSPILVPSNDVLEGDSITFKMDTHCKDFSAAWYFQSPHAPDYRLIEGATTLSYTIASVTMNDEGTYRGVLYDEKIRIFKLFQLRIQPYIKPVIIQQPKNSIVNEGAEAILTVTIQGSLPRIYWQRKTLSQQDWSTIPNTENSLLKFDNIKPSDEGVYRCITYNDSGSDTSNVVTIEVIAKPRFGSLPEIDNPLPLDHNFSFDFNPTGDSLRIFCQQNTHNGDQWQNIPELQSAVLVFAPLTPANSGLFRCIAENSAGIDTSEILRIETICIDSFFLSEKDTLRIKEGESFSVQGHAQCASERKWLAVHKETETIVSDSEVILTDTASRVSQDSLLTYRFKALYEDTWQVLNFAVLVKQWIPNPFFNSQTPFDTIWIPGDSIEIKPIVANLDSIKTSVSPDISYSWSLSNAQSAIVRSDSVLLLAMTDSTSQTEVSLCIDNGGKKACESLVVQYKKPVSLSSFEKFSLSGISLSNGKLTWHTNAHLRVWTIAGKLIFDETGRRGKIKQLSKRNANLIKSKNNIIQITPY